MKKRLLGICLSLALVLGLSVSAFAQGEETKFTSDYASPYTLFTNVVGGKLVYTNSQELPWFVGYVSFTLPPIYTNEFTFNVIKVYEEIQYKESEIVTNIWGNIDTNNYSGLVTNINLTYVTNRVVQHTITNTEYNTYSPNYRPNVDVGYSIPSFTYVYGGDIVAIELDYTNGVWVTLHGLR